MLLFFLYVPSSSPTLLLPPLPLLLTSHVGIERSRMFNKEGDTESFAIFQPSDRVEILIPYPMFPSPSLLFSLPPLSPPPQILGGRVALL